MQKEGVSMFQRYMSLITVIVSLCFINVASVFANSMDDLLLNAVANNNISMAQAALSNGANINCNQSSFTPLGRAIDNQYPEMVNFLIKMGADVNAVFMNGETRVTPLAFAAYKHEVRTPYYGQQTNQRNNDIKIFQSLVNAGADVNSIIENTGSSMFVPAVRSDGDTPLILSITKEHILGAGGSCLPMVKILLSKNVDVNKANGFGLTPLMVAADLLNNHYPWGKESRLEIAKLLLAAGADPNRVNQDGKTALQYAIKNNFTEMINLLLPISPKN